MYWRHALNGEARRLTREEEEEQPNLHFALWDRTEAIDEGEVCVLTCYEKTSPPLLPCRVCGEQKKSKTTINSS
jgi:hypothetical protein